jgi:hypothetical protein
MINNKKHQEPNTTTRNNNHILQRINLIEKQIHGNRFLIVQFN